MNVAFGQGLAVTPMQTAVADAALLNGGFLIPPTFEPRTAPRRAKLAVRVIKPEVSDELRYLFRLNVEKGSGRNADVPGYMVGGKTGTAQKVVNGRYSDNHRLNSFLAAFPIDDPQYVVLVVLDDPQAEKAGRGDHRRIERGADGRCDHPPRGGAARGRAADRQRTERLAGVQLSRQGRAVAT